LIVGVGKNQTNYIFLVLPSVRQEAESIRELSCGRRNQRRAWTMYQHDVQLLKMRNENVNCRNRRNE